MVEYRSISTTTPLFSIIIAVYNDWIALDLCLRSLAQQTNGPDFEVIVADDGSSSAAPDVIRQWVDCLLPLSIVRQSHAGISPLREITGFGFPEGRYCSSWTLIVESKQIASQPLVPLSQTHRSTIAFNSTSSEIAREQLAERKTYGSGASKNTCSNRTAAFVT